MRPHRIDLAATVLLLVFWASACAAYSSQSGSAQQSARRNHSEHLSTVGAKDFDPTNFDNSTTIDNKWFPLVPGAIPCSRAQPSTMVSAFPAEWYRLSPT